MRKKKSKLSMVAMILGIIAVIIEGYAMMSSSGGSEAEQVGEMIGKAIVAPSFFAMLVAVVLNIIGYFLVNRTLTLISAIIYIVALILMPLWGFIGIPSMILQFIAFAKMGKTKPNAELK